MIKRLIRHHSTLLRSRSVYHFEGTVLVQAVGSSIPVACNTGAALTRETETFLSDDTHPFLVLVPPS